MRSPGSSLTTVAEQEARVWLMGDKSGGGAQEMPGSGQGPYLAALHQLLLCGGVLVGGGGVLRRSNGLCG